ncbi:brachyurin-like isoform X2 [Ischnura elegans]|uniref:brachyurin-like isoform X2 n=1 Tax=Ischnura elegans TaxID=197161 RepID=UPI001ED89440|nr:brachyurin-like isoform X2 [Ischnura elegans]
MKLLLAILAIAAFACTQANSFETPVRLNTLHKLGKVEGLKNGNRVIRPKISGGLEASPGQFPYQAGLHIDNRDFCGATIIHESYVLTTATCADSGRTYTVYVGDIRLERDASPKQSLVSNEAIIHENYNNGFSYDIALIRLPYSLTFGDNIQSIGLPPFPDGIEKTAIVSGWGRTYDDGELSPILRYAFVDVITNDECKTVYGDLITDSLLCTLPDSNVEGSCYGDSGGPLLASFRSGDQIFEALAGISSFVNNRGCGVGPDGYTRVSTFVDWINNHLT